MKADKALNEDLLNCLEDKIPGMAAGAISSAYINALGSGRAVAEVVDGMIVETSADGDRKVICSTKPKHKVSVGSVINVRRVS
ncbi:hypothetical protein CYD26_20365 [Pseudomonas sp. FFUP_PS_473]|jgi:hypothetical protein|uniref:hypothetical protein n=1 Tax=Pseudomonas TaxID=286 RepID=UPI0008118A09|nr:MULTISPECIES: hypothetical protein [Pseudomonas]ATR81226.1 hypothetical protein CS390_01050 [Pseudomonas sp. HLS-6]PLP87840.1 hypothetical protein CYD26_20365 [Pseudomonas sp. FFUP_PS_473]